MSQNVHGLDAGWCAGSVEAVCPSESDHWPDPIRLALWRYLSPSASLLLLLYVSKNLLAIENFCLLYIAFYTVCLLLFIDIFALFFFHSNLSIFDCAQNIFNLHTLVCFPSTNYSPTSFAINLFQQISANIVH